MGNICGTPSQRRQREGHPDLWGSGREPAAGRQTWGAPLLLDALSSPPRCELLTRSCLSGSKVRRLRSFAAKAQ
jgi:hypothetical protein